MPGVPAQSRVGDPHARDGLQRIAVIDVARIEPRVKREVQTRGSRDAEIVQESLHLCGMLTGHPRCANQLEEPDRRDERPLHIEDLLRPSGRGMMLNPEVNPDGQMGVIADGEMPLERC